MKTIIDNFLGKTKISIMEPSYSMMKVSEIKTHEEISTIFEIEPEIINKIAASIAEHGFDSCEPLVIGRIKDLGDYLVDGHTRKEASIKAGLDKVPIKTIEFSTILEAQNYAILKQTNRRNLSQSGILNAVMLLKNKINRDGSGRSGKKLADDLGISESTITNAVFVRKNAYEKDILDIKEGRTTINKVRQKIKNEKTRKKSADKQTTLFDDFTISDSNFLAADKSEETISIPVQQDEVIESTNKNNILKTEVEEKPTNTKEQEGFSIVILNFYKDILEILWKNSEKNATKLLINEYQNCIPPNVLFELRKHYSSNLT